MDYGTGSGVLAVAALLMGAASAVSHLSSSISELEASQSEAQVHSASYALVTPELTWLVCSELAQLIVPSVELEN